MARKAKAAQPNATKPKAAKAAIKGLAGIQHEVRQSHTSITQKLQIVLNELDGVSFRSHEEAVSTTRLVQELMQQLGKRAQCPNTDQPCNLRCTQSGRGKVTTFQFDRVIDGKRKVTAATTTFPKIKLVDAPQDRRKRSPSR